jgi:dihydrofolate reductase
MRSISYYMAVSLDGFVSGKAGELGAFLFQGEHALEYQSEVAAAGAVLMGRKTYQLALNAGVDNPYPTQDTWVVSTTLAAASHPNLEVWGANWLELLRQRREQPGGNVVVLGGPHLAGQLLVAELLDELVLKINPIVLGSGVSLFQAAAHATTWKLASSKAHDNGVVVVRYQR